MKVYTEVGKAWLGYVLTLAWLEYTLVGYRIQTDEAHSGCKCTVAYSVLSSEI